MKLAVIVLAFNEAQHLSRCLASVEEFAHDVVVVDCYSTDDTRAIAESFGAKVLQNPWINYATQFNWALRQLDPTTTWILRLDADEYVTSSLATEITERLLETPEHVKGIYCNRRMTFQGKLIHWGGVFPIRVLRLFRLGAGECENRWMDEHIKVDGSTEDFKGDIIDDNLNSLTWWTAKHNSYASREVVDLLNLKYRFMPIDSVAQSHGGSQAGFKRWLKESIYWRLPGGLRAFAYFFFRYFLRLGFLDGQAGATFHVLQGFWYRFLIDAKAAEVERYMKSHNVDARIAIGKVLEIKL